MHPSILILSSVLSPLPATPKAGSSEQSLVIWFTGLPGSGKSSVCNYVRDSLKEKGFAVLVLRMDEQRRKYFPDPKYTSEERQKAYELFADDAVRAARPGRPVLLDATAPQVSMRRAVRDRVPRFAEVHIKCSLSTAMRREKSRPEGLVMADLYAKALERKKTGKEFPGLGRVIGVDVPFEMDPEAEMIIENDHLSLSEAGEKAMKFIEDKLLD